jgi:hypothetical protein
LVQGADIADLEVTLDAGVALEGTIVDERAQASPLRALPLVIGAFPEGGLASVDPNTGRFSIAGIHGDSIWLFAPPFVSIRSVTVGGQDRTDRPIDMRRGPTNVVVSITDAGAQVEGRVLDGRGRPVSNARVVFFPTDRGRWETTRRLGSVLTDRNGYYRLNRVTGLGLLPADEYYVAAVPDDGFKEFPRRLTESLRPVADTVVATWGQTTIQDLQIRTPAQ